MSTLAAPESRKRPADKSGTVQGNIEDPAADHASDE